MKLTVFSDGAARGNPGAAGAGFAVLSEDGAVLKEVSIPLGIATNNVAEYRALIEGARFALSLAPAHVSFRLDSELVVKQVLGEYRVKDDKLKVLFIELMGLLRQLKYDIAHVRREQNKQADKLANAGADQVQV